MIPRAIAGLVVREYRSAGLLCTAIPSVRLLIFTRQFLVYLIFSSALMAIALVMVSVHIAAWRKVERRKFGQAEYAFAWNQYRRRMQTSGMLVSLAVFIFVGQFVRPPLVAVFYWFGVLVMVIWIVVLALRDLSASQRHYSRLSRSNQAQQDQLKTEIKRLRNAAEGPSGNGHT